ncbi:hypothetical protein HHS_03950 [Candidatus Pantoea carbekii]|uniref:Lipoprotein n=1 Tax=Candidatus Pantoea carbekii TaxID=1235990 RepID=U3U630_9GAMM|nr:hypothetical protein HHS_03950 [Candidatus Pantoea carbekii]
MNYSNKYSISHIFFVFFALILLSACSNSSYQIHVLPIDNNNEFYLHSARLCDLKMPTGIILPLQHSEYDIPQNIFRGPIGNKLNIHPPITQSLSLMNVLSAEYINNTGIIYVNDSRSAIWPKIINIMHFYKLPIKQRDDRSQQLITDWIKCHNYDIDVNHHYKAFYQINLCHEDNRQILKVRLLKLIKGKKSVNSPDQIRYYTLQMLNDFILTMDDKIDAGNQSLIMKLIKYFKFKTY